MQYAWFAFAIFALFSFGGIFAEIATAMTRIAQAWDRYFGEATPEPWVGHDDPPPPIIPEAG